MYIFARTRARGPFGFPSFEWPFSKSSSLARLITSEYRTDVKYGGQSDSNSQRTRTTSTTF